MTNPNTCRCCGREVWVSDRHPIHTHCIPKHWSKHAHNVNASRCKEFGKRANLTK